MQATYQPQRFPIQAFAVVVTVLAALVIGSAGGYWLRSQSTSSVPVTAPAASQSVHVALPRASRESDVSHNTFGGLAARNELAGQPANTESPVAAGERPASGPADRESTRGPR